MTVLVNFLLYLGVFTVPVIILLIIRRFGRKYGLDDRYTAGDPTQEPDYRKWQR
jgi:hypothetical protein